MNYKKSLLLSTILLSSILISAMENKSDLTKPKIKIDFTNINWGEAFKKLPREIIKEILDYVFSDFNINKLEELDNFDELIKITELKKINKTFAIFILQNYSDKLIKISNILGKKLLKIVSKPINKFTDQDSALAIRLIKAGGSHDIIDESNLNVLMRASGFGHKNIVTELINEGADINKMDCNKKYTALILACTLNDKNIVIELLKSPQINLDIQDEFGYTALMLASRRNRPEIAQLLIKAGADLYLKCENQKTALDLAENNVIKKLLQEAITNNNKRKFEVTDFASNKKSKEDKK